MSEAQERTLIVSSPEVPSSLCPLDGHKLGPTDDADGTSCQCETCPHAVVGPFGKYVRKRKESLTVVCSYVKDETVDAPPYMVGCLDLIPGQMSREEYNSRAAEVKLLREMGQDVIFCGRCGLRPADTCPRGDDPLAPCQRP